MRTKFENVTIEEPKGQVSSKDPSRYYGSVKLKYRDPETKKKESIEVKINNPFMKEALEKYEIDEVSCDVTVELNQTNFGLQFGDILGIEVLTEV
jgi:adenine specific DNA methylase Mod